MKKKIYLEKTAVVFSDSLLPSVDIFMHCFRIPDVMVRIIKAREILKRHGFQIPEWMFGLVNKGEVFNSSTPLRLMSFLVNLGLYDRLMRLSGTPDFLIGHSPSLLVSAKVKSFDRSLIKIFRNVESKQEPFIAYQRKANNVSRFSLLHFSEAGGLKPLKSIVKEYGIDRCILICTSSASVTKLKSAVPTCVIDSLIETDANLNWFWPILKRNRLKKELVKITSGSLGNIDL